MFVKKGIVHFRSSTDAIEVAVAAPVVTEIAASWREHLWDPFRLHNVASQTLFPRGSCVMRNVE
jgi:hypothetical protein